MDDFSNFRSARWSRVSVQLLLAAAVGLAFDAVGHAQTPQFVSIVSGDGSSNNLTIDTNGTIVAANTLTDGFSDSGPTVGYGSGATLTTYAGYDLTDHVMGTLSTPTSPGFSTTASVGSEGGGTYDGGPATTTPPSGPTLTSENVTAYSSSSVTGDTGYYIYTVSFSVATATNDPFVISGSVNSDNETQDVILNYGTTSSGSGTSADPYTVTQTGSVLQLTANPGSQVQGTDNLSSNATFSTTVNGSNLGATNTLSFILYNHDGPTDLNFAFTAEGVPEPAAAFLICAGMPLLGIICKRRNTAA